MYILVFNNAKTCFVSWLKNFPKWTVTWTSSLPHRQFQSANDTTIVVANSWIRNNWVTLSQQKIKKQIQTETSNTAGSVSQGNVSQFNSRGSTSDGTKTFMKPENTLL